MPLALPTTHRPSVPCVFQASFWLCVLPDEISSESPDLTSWFFKKNLSPHLGKGHRGVVSVVNQNVSAEGGRVWLRWSRALSSISHTSWSSIWQCYLMALSFLHPESSWSSTDCFYICQCSLSHAISLITIKVHLSWPESAVAVAVALLDTLPLSWDPGGK